MPIYVYRCERKECKEFDHFSHKMVDPDVLISKLECPTCKSKNLHYIVKAPKVHFAQPEGTSKWDSFEYRAGYNLEKAQNERREAEKKSHMGSNPHVDINDVENFGEGIFDPKED